MTKKQLIFSRQDRILDAMLDKDYSGLSDLIHPVASVFGTALHEIEYGFLNVKNYYIKSLGQLPDEMFINPIWKRFTDFGNLALVEQEYKVEFIIDGEKVILPSMRQSTLWKNENGRIGDNVRKYIFYAIGEIVLIVIGILLPCYHCFLKIE